MEPSLHFIGKIHSQLKRLEDCPLQESENAPEATLEIYRPYAEGKKDIVVGDKLVLLTWFHLADRNTISCYRRNEVDSEKFGVFSTRSPDRPNPIGMHRVKVTEVMPDGFIKVFPLEALDGTPIVDIKPDIQ